MEPVSRTPPTILSSPVQAKDENKIALTTEQKPRFENVKSRGTRLEPREKSLKKEYPALTFNAKDVQALIKQIKWIFGTDRAVIQGGAVEEILTGHPAADVDISFYLDDGNSLYKVLDHLGSELLKKYRAETGKTDKSKEDMIKVYLYNKHKKKDNDNHLSFIRFGESIDFKFILKQKVTSDVRASGIQIDWDSGAISYGEAGQAEELPEALEDLYQKRLVFPHLKDGTSYNTLWRMVHYLTKGYKVDPSEWEDLLKVAIEIHVTEKPANKEHTKELLQYYLEGHYLDREEGCKRAFFFMWNLTELLLPHPEYVPVLKKGFEVISDADFGGLDEPYRQIVAALLDKESSIEEMTPIIRACLSCQYRKENPSDKGITLEERRGLPFSKACWNTSGSTLEHYRALIEMVRKGSLDPKKKTLISTLFKFNSTGDKEFMPSLVASLLDTLPPAALNEEAVCEFLTYLAMDVEVETLAGHKVRELWEKALKFRLQRDYETIAKVYIQEKKFSFTDSFCEELVKVLTKHHEDAMQWLKGNKWWELKLHLERLSDDKKNVESLIELPKLYQKSFEALEKDVIDRLSDTTQFWPQDDLDFISNIYRLMGLVSIDSQDLLILPLLHLILSHDNQLGGKEILSSTELKKLSALCPKFEQREHFSNNEENTQLLNEARLSLTLLLISKATQTDEKKIRLMEELIPLVMSLQKTLEAKKDKAMLERVEKTLLEHISVIQKNVVKGKARPIVVSDLDKRKVADSVSVLVTVRKLDALDFVLGLSKHSFLKDLSYPDSFWRCIIEELILKDIAPDKIAPVVSWLISKNKSFKDRRLYKHLFDRRDLFGRVFEGSDLADFKKYLISQAAGDQLPIAQKFQPGVAQESIDLANLEVYLKNPEDHLEALLQWYVNSPSKAIIAKLQKNINLLMKALAESGSGSCDLAISFIQKVFSKETDPLILNQARQLCKELTEKREWDMYTAIPRKLTTTNSIDIQIVAALCQKKFFSEERIQENLNFLINSLSRTDCPKEIYALVPQLLELSLKEGLSHCGALFEVIKDKQIDLSKNKVQCALLFIKHIEKASLTPKNRKLVEEGFRASLLEADQAFDLLLKDSIPRDEFESFKTFIKNECTPSKEALIKAMEKANFDICIFLLEQLVLIEDISSHLSKLKALRDWQKHPALMSLVAVYAEKHPKASLPFIDECLDSNIESGSNVEEWAALFVSLGSADRKLKARMLDHCLSKTQNEEFYSEAFAFVETLEDEQKKHYIKKLITTVSNTELEGAKRRAIACFDKLDNKTKDELFEPHLKNLFSTNPDEIGDFFSVETLSVEEIEIILSLPAIRTFKSLTNFVTELEKTQLKKVSKDPSSTSDQQLEVIFKRIIQFYPSDNHSYNITVAHLFINIPVTRKNIHLRLQICGLFIHRLTLYEHDPLLLKQVTQHALDLCRYEKISSNNKSSPFDSLHAKLLQTLKELIHVLKTHPNQLGVKQGQLEILYNFFLKMLPFMLKTDLDVLPFERVLLFLFASNPEKYHWKLLEFRTHIQQGLQEASENIVNKWATHFHNALRDIDEIKNLPESFVPYSNLYQATLYLIIPDSEVKRLYKVDNNIPISALVFKQLNPLRNHKEQIAGSSIDEKSSLGIHKWCLAELAMIKAKKSERLEEEFFAMYGETLLGKINHNIVCCRKKIQESGLNEDILKLLMLLAQVKSKDQLSLIKQAHDKAINSKELTKPEVARLFLALNQLYLSKFGMGTLVGQKGENPKFEVNQMSEYYLSTPKAIKALSKSPLLENHRILLKLFKSFFQGGNNIESAPIFNEYKNEFKKHFNESWKNTAQQSFPFYLELLEICSLFLEIFNFHLKGDKYKIMIPFLMRPPKWPPNEQDLQEIKEFPDKMKLNPMDSSISAEELKGFLDFLRTGKI